MFFIALGLKEIWDMYFASGTWCLIRKREIRYPTKFLNSLIFSQDKDFYMKTYVFLPFVISPSFVLLPVCLVVHMVIHVALLGVCLFSHNCPRRYLLWEPGKVSQLLHSWAASPSCYMVWAWSQIKKVIGMLTQQKNHLTLNYKTHSYVNRAIICEIKKFDWVFS